MSKIEDTEEENLSVIDVKEWYDAYSTLREMGKKNPEIAKIMDKLDLL